MPYITEPQKQVKHFVTQRINDLISITILKNYLIGKFRALNDMSAKRKSNMLEPTGKVTAK